ncbi:MAG: hypothetical protein L0H29_01935, partial [Sinobacteraceae bacterium]|nr:hypothetical protein [Nevskiaceae bacterium]
MAESAKSNALFSAAQNIRSLKSTRSLSELLPWAIALTRDVVLCKDGALLAGFVYDGLNTEGRSETELAADAALLE